MTESNPLDTGRSVMRSIEQWAKGQSDSGPGMGMRAGFVRFRLILNC